MLKDKGTFGEIAHLVKYMIHNHKDLSLEPQHEIKTV